MNTHSAISTLRIVLGAVVGFYAALLPFTSRVGKPIFLCLYWQSPNWWLPSSSSYPGPHAWEVLRSSLFFLLAAAFHVLRGEYDVGYLAVYGAAALAAISHRERM